MSGSELDTRLSWRYGNIRDTAFHPLVKQGKWLLVIPIALGLLLYARFSEKYGYLARWRVALTVGIGTGVLLKACLQRRC